MTGQRRWDLLTAAWGPRRRRGRAVPPRRGAQGRGGPAGWPAVQARAPVPAVANPPPRRVTTPVALPPPPPHTPPPRLPPFLLSPRVHTSPPNLHQANPLPEGRQRPRPAERDRAVRLWHARSRGVRGGVPPNRTGRAADTAAAAAPRWCGRGGAGGGGGGGGGLATATWSRAPTSRPALTRLAPTAYPTRPTRRCGCVAGPTPSESGSGKGARLPPPPAPSVNSLVPSRLHQPGWEGRPAVLLTAGCWMRWQSTARRRRS